MESIDLDCAPGPVRPWDLIKGVIAGTILDKPDFDPGHSAFFGASVWTFDVPRDIWVSEVQPVIKPRIEALYHQGTIRYGTW